MFVLPRSIHVHHGGNFGKKTYIIIIKSPNGKTTIDHPLFCDPLIFDIFEGYITGGSPPDLTFFSNRRGKRENKGVSRK